ncbi:MAG: hypothetical protein R2712_26625 [Vicinamibacterales bacterium]
MSQLNAFRAIKAVHGKLPVNLIFIAEGDEERMDIGLRQFVKDHPELLEGADGMLRFGSQSNSGNGGFGGGSKAADVELTTSGTSWGRGRRCRTSTGATSAAWTARRRHIKMLASLVSEDGNTPLIDGFFDGIQPLTEWQEASLRGSAERTDLTIAAENLGVARFISEDPHDAQDAELRHVVQSRRHLGRQHVCGRRGRHPAEQDHVQAQLPLRAQHDGPRHREKLRKQLDKNGFKDVEVKLIGDVPWAKMNSTTTRAAPWKRA